MRHERKGRRDSNRQGKGHVDRQEVRKGRLPWNNGSWWPCLCRNALHWKAAMHKPPTRFIPERVGLVKTHFIFRRENSPSALAPSQLGLLLGNCCFYISVSFHFFSPQGIWIKNEIFSPIVWFIPFIIHNCEPASRRMLCLIREAGGYHWGGLLAYQVSSHKQVRIM